jgi:transcription elongation factor Elf1
MVIPSESHERARDLSTTCELLSYATAVEHHFMCPYCGEEISMILDLFVPRQVYIEDCEVCCNPIEISYTAEDDLLTSFNAKRIE